jgi:hypothetical protein
VDLTYRASKSDKEMAAPQNPCHIDFAIRNFPSEPGTLVTGQQSKAEIKKAEMKSDIYFSFPYFSFQFFSLTGHFRSLRSLRSRLGWALHR